MLLQHPYTLLLLCCNGAACSTLPGVRLPTTAAAPAAAAAVAADSDSQQQLLHSPLSSLI
jgi:hypothetical protein